MKPLKKYIDIETAILCLLLLYTVVGILGGFMYLFFPRPDDVGDDFSIRVCNNSGGAAQWSKWPNGCGPDHDECYLLTCTLENK